MKTYEYLCITYGCVPYDSANDYYWNALSNKEVSDADIKNSISIYQELLKSKDKNAIIYGAHVKTPLYYHVIYTEWRHSFWIKRLFFDYWFYRKSKKEIESRILLFKEKLNIL